MNRNQMIGLIAVTMLLAAPFARAEEPITREATHESSFQLNDGQKWRTDTHTREAIKAIRNAVETSATSNLPDLKALGTTLQVQIDSLIRGCTMTGEAHAQLHIFLSKFMPAVASLHDATDRAAASQNLEEIHLLLAEYDEFFE